VYQELKKVATLTNWVSGASKTGGRKLKETWGLKFLQYLIVCIGLYDIQSTDVYYTALLNILLTEPII